jgi:YVTN family beta-propeller protein
MPATQARRVPELHSHKWLRNAALAIVAFCGAAAAHGDVLLVGNKSGDTLWALDLAGGGRTAVFDTGIGPHEVEISPDGRYAVVSNYGNRAAPGNSLTVIDWPAGKVARIVNLGADSQPHGMAFLPNGRLAVTTEGSDHVLVVDVQRGEVLQRIPVGEGVAHMVAVSGEGQVAWVTNISAGTLEKVDLEAGKVVGAVRTGAGAEGVGVAREGREVWVTNRADDTVSVVDAGSLEILATLASAGFPIRVAMTPDGRHALVTNARAATLSVFSVESRKLIATIQVADPDAEYQETLLGRAALPIGIAVHPDGARAFVAISGGDEVAVINTGDWRVVERWPTGREPDALGVIVSGR